MVIFVLVVAVLRARFVSAQGIKGGPLIVTIYVDEVLKSTSVVIPTQTQLTLWAGRGCVCPRLHAGRAYLFLGFEDTENNRLLFDETCIAVTWRDVWYGRIRVSYLVITYQRPYIFYILGPDH